MKYTFREILGADGLFRPTGLEEDPEGRFLGATVGALVVRLRHGDLDLAHLAGGLVDVLVLHVGDVAHEGGREAGVRELYPACGADPRGPGPCLTAELLGCGA